MKTTPVSSDSPGVNPRRRLLELIPDSRWRGFLHELRLSDREAEVLRGILEDERVAQIAERLEISPFTVDTYRERLFRKMHVSSTTQLVAAVFAAYIQYADFTPLGALDG